MTKKEILLIALMIWVGNIVLLHWLAEAWLILPTENLWRIRFVEGMMLIGDIIAIVSLVRIWKADN